MKRSGQHALPVNEVLANGLSNIEIDPSDTAAACNQRMVGAYRSRSCFHREICTRDICRMFTLAHRANSTIASNRNSSGLGCVQSLIPPPGLVARVKDQKQRHLALHRWLIRFSEEYCPLVEHLVYLPP